MILGLILSCVLVPVAALHLLWGIGYWVPIQDEAALARAVVGAKGMVRMPGPVPCALVVVALLFAVMCLWWPASGLRSWTVGAIGAVFLARGAVAYTAFWRKLTPEQPFATLDMCCYAPLCLALGLGFLVSV